ncbi:amidohydrolase [Brevibacterium sp. 5221]|uniref:Amidohydrolase n=1 Tax=Brevibacterium rongguiense TaxID=2695267 RepID=A0A6N9HAP6_9MICO|nr:M20 family metallopeptidase [Brevibacterium rongguiense]MYM20574.1 amidohydrolase [Brevibacterium rongguiense]
MTFAAAGEAMLDELVALRRAIHADPEVGLELPRTQRRVLDALEGLPLEIALGQSTTSVTAVLRGTGRAGGGAGPAPAVLLRGDMDALPLTELTGLDYAATGEAMHACGHDLHMAALVGAARILGAHRDELPGDVVFMFQPGEEGYGGARNMIAEGVLDAAGPRIVAAYATHVSPSERGVFSTREGTLASGSCFLTITVRGQGGHASQPQDAVDPVPVAAEIILALQAMVTRRISVFDPVVLSLTQLSAGQTHNIIPDSATLSGTVRVLSNESLEIVRTESQRVAQGVAAAHGCAAEVDFRVDYPVTVNDSGEARRALAVLRELVGEDRVIEADHPIMPSEDFSYVLDAVPGAFVMLGAGDPSIPAAERANNHSPRVVFDDSVLGIEAAALASLARARLAAEAPAV